MEEFMEGSFEEDEMPPMRGLMPYEQQAMVAVPSNLTRGVNRDTYRAALLQRYLTRLNGFLVAEVRRTHRRNIEIWKAFTERPEFKAYLRKERAAIAKLNKARAEYRGFVKAEYGSQASNYYIDGETKALPAFEDGLRGNRGEAIIVQPVKTSPLGKVLAGMGFVFREKSEWEVQVDMQADRCRPEIMRLLGAITTSRRQWWDELDGPNAVFIRAIDLAKTEAELVAAANTYADALLTSEA